MKQTKQYKKTTDLAPKKFQGEKRKKEGRKLSKTVNISPDPDFQMERARFTKYPVNNTEQIQTTIKY